MNYLKIAGIFLFFSSFFVSAHIVHGIANYKAIPLNCISIKTPNGSIYLDHYVFNRGDCKKFLGRDKIIQKGYQPVQVTLINNSDKSLILSLKNFSFPCVPYYEIAEAVRFDTTKRVLGWGIPGLFIWPLLIPAVIEAFESPKANERLLVDYSQKALQDQIIQPYTTINGVIFVAVEQFAPVFSLTLIDKANGEEIKFST